LVFVKADGGHRHVVEHLQRLTKCRLISWRSDVARCHDLTAFTEARDLSKIAKVNYVILDDSVDLIRLQVCFLKRGGKRLQNFGIGGDVTPNLFRRSRSDVQVALHDGSACAALE
ncbi:MAG TPA: hypothetical protein VJP86_02340, partial [Vicinamibacterales bacterium]|nr:hypothetical protein [Vicinamibacterales bacterium]